MTLPFAESVVEDAALTWLERLGYQVLYGPTIDPGAQFAEREDPAQVVLSRRLRQALDRLNPDLPPAALDDAFRRLTRVDGPTWQRATAPLHRMLTDGVDVEYRRRDGRIAGAQARVLDLRSPRAQRLAGGEPVHGGGGTSTTAAPDVVLFVNGLPLAVIELKNPADENATIWTAFSQFQTYKHEIPSSSPTTRSW